MREKILKILKENCCMKSKEIAVMISANQSDVKKEISEMEKEGIILGYSAIIDYEKTNSEVITALIELKVTPQLGEGFDAIAEKIYKYDQVKSVYLMSGGYDLAVVVEGNSMKDVALFVAESLSPMDSVLSTATHFILRKYKESGLLFNPPDRDDRQVITL